MKPIEEGCTAIIIGTPGDAGLDGTMVQVGKFIGRRNFVFDKNLWEVDKELPYTDGGGKVTMRRICPESNLMRIDGHDSELEDVGISVMYSLSEEVDI